MKRTNRLLQALHGVLPTRWAGAWYDRRERAIERPHLEAFQRFYASLPNQRDIFYIYFSSGLLQWLSRAVAFVPPEVNLVLLGSSLEPSEQQWIRQSIDRPFHHIDLRADDKTAWRFLCETSRHNFGWLDVDCFVLEPDLFGQMAEIGPQDAINCTWAFKGPNEIDVLLTYFLFVNVDVLRQVRDAVPEVSPVTYAYELSREGRPAPHGWCRIPSTREVESLGRVLPTKGGRPVYLSEDSFYDTLQVYQMVAHDRGFGLHRVRDLNPGPDLYSEELVHVGKVSYYKRWKDKTGKWEQTIYAILSQVEYVLLSHLGDDLPDFYQRMREEIGQELDRLGLGRDLDTLRRTITAALGTRGAHPGTLERILSSD